MVRLLLVLAILLVAPVARAQDVPPPTDATAALEARTLFEDGVRMSRDERWAEALDRFRRSRALVPRPSTLFNIALYALTLVWMFRRRGWLDRLGAIGARRSAPASVEQEPTDPRESVPSIVKTES